MLIALLLMAPPGALCKSKRAKNADAAETSTSTTQPSSPDAPGNATDPAASAPTSTDQSTDVNKTLDDVLSKPIDTLLKEAPKPQLLQGQAEVDNAATGADASNDPNALPVRGLKPLGPKNPAPVLQGSASLNGTGGMPNQDDPDLGNDALSIAWDRWRNRLLRAVQMQVQASVNSPDSDEYVRPRFDRFTGMPLPRFPLGTEAWFDCEVTNDNRIARCMITQSSGFPAYDRAVLNGIRALDGTSLLTFPQGSRRTSVRQEAGIRTATQSNFNYYHFGDVERYNVPQRGY
jgi:hypothetical protein